MLNISEFLKVSLFRDCLKSLVPLILQAGNILLYVVSMAFFISLNRKQCTVEQTVPSVSMKFCLNSWVRTKNRDLDSSAWRNLALSLLSNKCTFT